MPTYAKEPRFRREFTRLSRAQQEAFLAIIPWFVEGLRRGRFDPRLRLKRVQSREDVWEVTWAEIDEPGSSTALK